MDTNLTSNYANYKLPAQEVVILVFLNGCGCVLGTAANSLVIIVIWNMRRLRTSRNYILASLSGSDLVSCVIWQPLLIDSILHGLRLNTWVSFCTFFAGLSSLNNLVCLTAERFIAVHFPFRYLRCLNARRVKIICFTAYSLSFLLAILVACANLSVQVVHFYIVFLTLAMLVIYINIYLTAIKQVRRINAMHITPVDAVVSQTPAANTIGSSYTTASVGIVVWIYCLCWLPYILLPAIPKQHFSHAFPWINTFAVVQSNINPFLYFWKFAKFRRESKRFWQKLKIRAGMIE